MFASHLSLIVGGTLAHPLPNPNTQNRATGGQYDFTDGARCGQTNKACEQSAHDSADNTDQQIG